MQLTDGFQLSLFGKTSWEAFHQATGLILRPCSGRSQIPTFQFLLLEDGPTPEWCEAEGLTSAGGSWTPNIGQAPAWRDGREFSSWRILEGGVLTKYCLSPAQCSRFLRLAEKAGCPPPRIIEALLLKQGGEYPSSDPFKCSVCAALRMTDTTSNSGTASDSQMTLFPLF